LGKSLSIERPIVEPPLVRRARKVIENADSIEYHRKKRRKEND